MGYHAASVGKGRSPQIGPHRKMKMARTNVEWVAQVSLLRPGPPTQSLDVAAHFLCRAKCRCVDALPNPAAVCLRHRLTGLAGECLLKLRHVHHQAVDTVLARGMRICDRVHAQVFRAVVFASPLRVSHKKALLGSEPVPAFQMHVSGLLLPGYP